MPIELGAGGLGRAAPDLDGIQNFYDAQGFGRMLREQARRVASNSAPVR